MPVEMPECIDRLTQAQGSGAAQTDTEAGKQGHLQDLSEGHVSCSHLPPTKPAQNNHVRHSHVAKSAVPALQFAMYM